MNILNLRELFLLTLFGVTLCISLPQRAFCQKETLGTISYATPAGFTKTTKENIVAFSKVDPATGKFCIITLYGATPGTGKPDTDFKREWANIVLKNMKADASPKTESEAENGWTATGGGSAIESEAGPAIALLTVITGGDRTVSILGVFNDPAFAAPLAAFNDSIDLGKAVADAPAPQILNGNGGLRQLTIADIAGEWGEASGFNTRYVDRATGVYAGADSVHFSQKMTFTSSGGFADDFFGLSNGRKITGTTTGTVTIVGRVLTIINGRRQTKYVIRGWQEFANMTVLNVCGPWYDDQPIPESVFTIPDSSVNLDKTWIRKK